MAEDTVLAQEAVGAGSTLARTAKGAGWTIGWRLCNRMIGLGSTLILVRLLAPEDFGLASLAVGFFQSLDQMAAFGAEGAIIRASRTDRDILDAGFTLNVLRGAITAGLLAVAAGPVSVFFANPQLQDCIHVLAIIWVLSSFQNIGIVEFRRALAFEQEFRLQMISRIAGTLVTILAAVIFRSYWALIAGMGCSKLVSLVLSYTMHPYRPRFGIAGLPYIFSFSFWEWAISILNVLGQRSDALVIGRLMGAASVGVYGVGTEVSSLASSEIVAPLCRALFSGVVAEKHSGRDGTEIIFRIFAALAVVTFPISMGLSLEAGSVVKLAFGDEWMGAVPLIRVAGGVAVFILFSSISEALFSAHAWLRSILWVSLSTTVLRIGLMVAAVTEFGVVGAILAASVVSLLQEIMYVGIAWRRLRFQFRSLIVSIIRPALAVGVMAAVLFCLGLGWNDPPATARAASLCTTLALGTIIGAITYSVVLASLWLLAGRPSGAEADLFAAGSSLIRSRRWR